MTKRNKSETSWLCLQAESPQGLPRFPKLKKNRRLSSSSSTEADLDDYTVHFSLLDPALFTPHIIKKLPSEYESVVGAQCQFSCLTTVLFPVECHWYLNGTLVDHESSNGRIYSKDGGKTLVILSLREQDHGKLVMVARNPFGKTKTSCRLNIVDNIGENKDKSEKLKKESKVDKLDPIPESKVDIELTHFSLHNEQRRHSKTKNIQLSRSY
ncbi:titin-like isoform X2 [Clytia hemisphaerica]|uniref:titin-like isoform X2 n=1 Tax=Clytia hemisphaerica TaxID=252671 RepID=UPI0034D3E6A0